MLGAGSARFWRGFGGSVSVFAFRLAGLVAGALLIPCDPDSHGGAWPERVDGGARVRMRVETMTAACAGTPPFTDKQSAAEEIGPDLEAVVAVLVALGQGADQGCGFRKEWKLDWSGPGRGGFVTFGHRVAGSVTRTRAEH